MIILFLLFILTDVFEESLSEIKVSVIILFLLFILTDVFDNNNNNFIKMATIAVELYNWHSKTTNDNKLIKTKI